MLIPAGTSGLAAYRDLEKLDELLTASHYISYLYIYSMYIGQVKGIVLRERLKITTLKQTSTDAYKGTGMPFSLRLYLSASTSAPFLAFESWDLTDLRDRSMEHVRRNVNGHLQTGKAWTCLKSFHQRSAAQEKLLRVKKRTEVATLIYIANLAPEWIQYCWWMEIVYSIQRFTRAYEREVLQVVLLQRDLLQVTTSLAGSATCRIWNFCRLDGRLEPRRNLAGAGAVSGHLGPILRTSFEPLGHRMNHLQ